MRVLEIAMTEASFFECDGLALTIDNGVNQRAVNLKTYAAVLISNCTLALFTTVLFSIFKVKNFRSYFDMYVNFQARPPVVPPLLNLLLKIF